MIHIVGVDHRVQWMRVPTGISSHSVPKAIQDGINCYLSTVREKVFALNVTVFAEEYSQELHDNKGTQSTFLDLKQEIERTTGSKIGHLFIEPTCDEKKARNYKELEDLKTVLTTRLGSEPKDEVIRAHCIAHQFPIRERFWVDRLRNYFSSSILLVCGEIHTYTLPRLLACEGIDHRIVAHGIGVRHSDDADHRGLRYAEENSMFDNTACFCTN